MAVRAVNTCAVLHCASSPPLLPPLIPAFRCRLRHFVSVQSRRHAKQSIRFRMFPTEKYVLLGHGAVWSGCSVHSQSLVESVMEELEASRRRRRIRAAISLLKISLTSEYCRRGRWLSSGKILKGYCLQLLRNPMARRIGWCPIRMASPPPLNHNKLLLLFRVLKISITQKYQTLFRKLRIYWTQLYLSLPGMIFGNAEPLESYCAHLLLSKDEIYFTVLESKGPRSIYGPRSAVQVDELLRGKLAKEAAEKELQEFVHLLRSAKAMAPHAKPPKSSWKAEEKIKIKIESLEAYAIDACKNDEQNRTAGTILKSVGLAKTASSAVNLLIDIGFFPVHVNLDFLKLNIRTGHSEEIISTAEDLLSDSSDLDEINRKDLTHLKVYAIDVDEADELDDALSAMRLQDGRFKVWIHVADPTNLVQPGSIIDREAMRRGTSVFLPTATYPIFPERLAMEGMSLKQGKLCNAVSVSVVLHSDGSIAEFAVDNSIIKPTYMLTYESASELIHLNLEEEVELKVLSEAAALRLKWRCNQGAIDTATLETRIKVTNPDDPEPSINLYVENQADPAMRLVSEMMILCGETITTYGSRNNIPLPYRGQPQSNIDASAFAHLPEGPVRSSALVKIMRAAEMDFRKPIRHGVLGLSGYVQFTSPIRRYMDLLAHYQIKAFLRGDSPPFSAGQLEGMASDINMNVRVARRLFSSSLRYWILEFLRRQPKERKFHALILKFIKDRIAALLLTEVGFQTSAWVSVGKQIGDEVTVQVVEAHPRDDILSLKEVV